MGLMYKGRILLGLIVLAGLGIAGALLWGRRDHVGGLAGRSSDDWLRRLQSSDADTRRQAALALGEANTELANAGRSGERARVVEGLLAALSDPEPFVRKCAATSIRMFPPDAVTPEQRPAVPGLCTALQDSEPTVRRTAAQALAQIGDPEAVPALTAALRDPEDAVREYAARALGRIGPAAKPAVPTLIDLLQKDEERDVREHAAKSLGLIGREALGDQVAAAVAALTRGLKDEERDVRENSARTLGQLGDASRAAIPALREAAKEDKDREVRREAAEALKILEGGQPAPSS